MKLPFLQMREAATLRCTSTFIPTRSTARTGGCTHEKRWETSMVIRMERAASHAHWLCAWDAVFLPQKNRSEKYGGSG